jgi:hypothetical protein
MKVLIGVDPHKASVALAALDELGELIECASFPQNRAGLRALECWAKQFPERRWAVENAGGLGDGAAKPRGRFRGVRPTRLRGRGRDSEGSRQLPEQGRERAEYLVPRQRGQPSGVGAAGIVSGALAYPYSPKCLERLFDKWLGSLDWRSLTAKDGCFTAF